VPTQKRFASVQEGVQYYQRFASIRDAAAYSGLSEYEAAFYADTTNAKLDTTVNVGNHLSSLQ
jgi:hypothetical protein